MCRTKDATFRPRRGPGWHIVTLFLKQLIVKRQRMRFCSLTTPPHYMGSRGVLVTSESVGVSIFRFFQRKGKDAAADTPASCRRITEPLTSLHIILLTSSFIIQKPGSIPRPCSTLSNVLGWYGKLKACWKS